MWQAKHYDSHVHGSRHVHRPRTVRRQDSVIARLRAQAPQPISQVRMPAAGLPGCLVVSLVLGLASTARGLQPRVPESVPPKAQAEAAGDEAARVEVLRGRCREALVRLKVPGCSLAVIDGYRVVHAEGFGRRAADGDEPVTTTTRFQSASISKLVTACAVARLVHAGRLNLDEPVNSGLRTWRLPDNEFTARQPVTLRLLLCHGAGTTVSGFPGYAAGAALPALEQILDGQPPANTPAVRVDRLPGEGFRYSGGGTTIVQQLLIDRTGQPFGELLREQILDPLEMTHSAFAQPPDRAWVAACASGHDDQGAVIPGRWHVYPELAAAGLWTTAGDLALAAIEIQRAAMRREPRVLDPEAVTEMLRPQVARQIGLGPFLRDPGPAERFFHSGGNEGFTCLLVATRQTGQGVVILTNSSRGILLCDFLVHAVAELWGWPRAEKPSG